MVSVFHRDRQSCRERKVRERESSGRFGSGKLNKKKKKNLDISFIAFIFSEKKKGTRESSVKTLNWEADALDFRCSYCAQGSSVRIRVLLRFALVRCRFGSFSAGNFL